MRMLDLLGLNEGLPIQQANRSYELAVFGEMDRHSSEVMLHQGTFLNPPGPEEIPQKQHVPSDLHLAGPKTNIGGTKSPQRK